MNRFFTYNKLAAFVLVFYSVIQIFCLNQLSINYDEPLFSSYGASILKFQREKDVVLYDSKLPITALNMLPRALEQIFRPGLKKTYENAQLDIMRGRYISLLVSVLLGLLIFHWAKKLYNPRTAFFSLLFYLLCPNFLAHGIFLSSDIFACFFMTLGLYYLWRFCNEHKKSFFVLMSIATALAEISKFSMIHLFIIIPLLLIVARLGMRNLHPQKNYFTLRRVVAYSFLFLIINWLIVCSAHFFYQVFLPINDYNFMSSACKALQNSLPWLSVPLPSSYVRSMDAVIYFDQLGGGMKNSLNGPSYILGESSGKGFWYYYFVVIFFKMPIPILIVWLASILLVFSNFKRRRFFTAEVFLLLPALYFLIYMNFFYSTQVGIRHIMIIFPLLYVLSGKIISRLFEWRRQWLLYLLIAWQAISVFRYFPHFLPYTNEFILQKKMAYKKLADTNLCYGEGKKFLEKYVAKNKQAIVLPEKPVAGKVVMEVNEMLNMDIRTMGKYDWIKKLTPIDHIHSQYLVFNVPQTFIDSLNRR